MLDAPQATPPRAGERALVRAVAEALTLAALLGAWSVIAGYEVDGLPSAQDQALLRRRLRARFRRAGAWREVFQGTASDIAAVAGRDLTTLHLLQEAQRRAPVVAAQIRLDRAARAAAANASNDVGKSATSEAVRASPILAEAKQRELGRARYEILSLDFYRAAHPFWRYTSVLDSATTQGCRALSGLTMPAKDPRWPGYVPPRHWKCRAHIEAVTHSAGVQAALKEPPLEHAGAGTFATLLDEWEPRPESYPADLWAIYAEARGIASPHLELDGPWWRKDFDAGAR